MRQLPGGASVGRADSSVLVAACASSARRTRLLRRVRPRWRRAPRLPGARVHLPTGRVSREQSRPSVQHRPPSGPVAVRVATDRAYATRASAVPSRRTAARDPTGKLPPPRRAQVHGRRRESLEAEAARARRGPPAPTASARASRSARARGGATRSRSRRRRRRRGRRRRPPRDRLFSAAAGRRLSMPPRRRRRRRGGTAGKTSPRRVDHGTRRRPAAPARRRRQRARRRTPAASDGVGKAALAVAIRSADGTERAGSDGECVEIVEGAPALRHDAPARGRPSGRHRGRLALDLGRRQHATLAVKVDVSSARSTSRPSVRRPVGGAARGARRGERAGTGARMYIARRGGGCAS